MLPTEQNRCIHIPNGILTVGGDTIRLSAYGKTFYFEWHNYLGPMFVTKRGSELKNPPGERNPWWKAFSLWDRQGKRTRDGECLWDAGTTCHECNGKGHVPGNGKLTGLRSPCHTCHGEGATHSIPTSPWKGW